MWYCLPSFWRDGEHSGVLLEDVTTSLWRRVTLLLWRFYDYRRRRRSERGRSRQVWDWRKLLFHFRKRDPHRQTAWHWWLKFNEENLTCNFIFRMQSYQLLFNFFNYYFKQLNKLCIKIQVFGWCGQREREKHTKQDRSQSYHYLYLFVLWFSPLSFNVCNLTK
jgi:hypothetical protein